MKTLFIGISVFLLSASGIAQELIQIEDVPTVTEQEPQELVLRAGETIAVSVKYTTERPKRTVVQSYTEAGLCAKPISTQTKCTPTRMCVCKTGLFCRSRFVEKCVYDCESTVTFKACQASRGQFRVVAAQKKGLGLRQDVLNQVALPVIVE